MTREYTVGGAMKRSQETKTIIADRFKQLLSQKPLSKITIRELISDCAINRKTFYYHFEDIYALLKWTLEREVITVADQFDLLAETDEMVSFVLLYIEQNRVLLKNMYQSVGKDTLYRFFYRDISRTVEKLFAPRLEGVTDEEYRAFLLQFYTEGMICVLHNWMMARPDADRDQVAGYIVALVRSAPADDI